MKSKVCGGAAVAVAALSMVLAGVAPAAAKGKAHRAQKPAAEKHNCGGKNGCPAASESSEKPAAAPTAPKPAETK